MVNNELVWQIWTDNSFESFDREDIEKIAQSPGICDYNITTAVTPVNPVGFKRIEDANCEQYDFIDNNGNFYDSFPCVCFLAEKSCTGNRNPVITSSILVVMKNPKDILSEMS